MKFNRPFICSLWIALLLSFGPQGIRAQSVPRFAPRSAAKGERVSSPLSAPPQAHRAELNRYQKERLERFLAGTAAANDTLRLIAIQVQFSDSLMGGQGAGGRAERHDSLYFANELEHAEQYFDGASRMHLAMRWDVTGGVYSLPQPMGYYGDDAEQDTRAVELMQSVIDSADDDIDFSGYDAVMLIHAGAGQETDVADNSRNQLWSSFYSQTDIDAAFPDSTVRGLPTNDTLGGEPFLVDNFLLVPEAASQDDFTIGSLGIWAFELGSRLGLLPLSDSTPEGSPDSRGVASYDLMASGLYNGCVTPDLRLWPGFVPGFPSVFNRLVAGWIDPVVVEKDGPYRLHDVNSPTVGDTACIKIPITESEYYLVVNRAHDANFDSLFTFTDLDSNFFPDNTDSLGGAEFDFFVTVLTDPFVVKPDPDYGGRNRIYMDTGSGMYIWHIDENVIRQMISTGHLPNDFVSRKGVDLEEADGVQDLDGTSDPFSFGSHFDSFRESNNSRFGPDTKPSTFSNSGAATGITVGDISKPGPTMTCTIAFSAPYEETRTRWPSGSRAQPPSLIDLDGNAGLEIVAFADTANVYAFTTGGAEFADTDGDPTTVEPFITAAGARWTGAPAFGDIDGDGEAEIVACDEGGAVYAWNKDRTEVFDGDANPATTGILYKGEALASPPMLVDVDNDGAYETFFVEQKSLVLVAEFVDGRGILNQPSGSNAPIEWAAPVNAQVSSPLAFGALGDANQDSEGVAFAWADTVGGFVGLSYCPFRFRGVMGVLEQESYRWTPAGPVPSAFPAASSIAVGDLDGNGFDEAVFAVSDGRLAIYPRRELGPDRVAGSDTPGLVQATPPAASPPPVMFIELRSTNPSAPALGDIDGNGTFEIALWDDGYYYLFEHNGRLRTNWPQPLRANALGNFPDLTFDERLTSPLVGDVDGNGRVEILFPRGDGGVHGYDAGGAVVAGYPRSVPDGIGATPSVADLEEGGALSLVCLGGVASIATVDAVKDTLYTLAETVLSIQSFPGSHAGDAGRWFAYQAGLDRQGRVVRMGPPATATSAVEPGTFKVYPNPVRGGEVHARVVLNTRATVLAEVYNLEGNRAASVQESSNTGSVVGTPFDEAIDVSQLKSGVYMLRLVIDTASGTEVFVGSFAILR